MFALEAYSDKQHRRQFTMAGYAAEGTITITLDADTGYREEQLGGTPYNAVDSLVGREPELNEVLNGPPEGVQRLGMLRAFMLAPVS